MYLTPDDQVEMDLTVYSGFALVRDVRETTLPEGAVTLEYEGVAHTVEPASVRVRSLDGGALEVVRQSYQYDLLSKQSLLERYIGHKLKYVQRVAGDDNVDRIVREGVLLSIDPEIVKFGDESKSRRRG
ncbi:MAG: hypothetical protein U5O39_07775 [Gammaproteobacteria bacterium]|nr:hypothetical protein [Gammaproteobacteria bacterium]